MDNLKQFIQMNKKEIYSAGSAVQYPVDPSSSIWTDIRTGSNDAADPG